MLNTKAETKTDPNYTAKTLKCHRTRKTTNGKINKCFNKKNQCCCCCSSGNYYEKTIEQLATAVNCRIDRDNGSKAMLINGSKFLYRLVGSSRTKVVGFDKTFSLSIVL